MERKIRNIIFDLGGVILNIDYQRTEKAFTNLGLRNFKELYSKQQQINLFDKFETGELSVNEFREGVRNISGISLSDTQIDDAWNNMLIDLPEKNLSFLKALKNSYRLFLLSNTNEIHINGFTAIIKKAYGKMPFDELFEKTYYSNKVGLRKPDKQMFSLVLEENNLDAKETLFIDDSAQHLTGASAAGIKTRLVSTGVDLYEELAFLL